MLKGRRPTRAAVAFTVDDDKHEMSDLRQAERLVAPSMIELDVAGWRQMHEKCAESWRSSNVLGNQDVLSALHRLLLPRHAAARVEERQLALWALEGETSVLLARDRKLGTVSQQDLVRQTAHGLAH